MASPKSSRGPVPGDIVLFARARGLNRLITFLTRSRYYHVAIFAGGSHVVEARPGGVINRDLNGPEGTPMSAFVHVADGERALAWAKTQIGDKYDRVGVLVIVLDRIFRHLRFHYAPKGRYSCAEFVAVAFEKVGKKLFDDLKPEAVVPGDFERLHPHPVGRGSR